MKIDKQSKYTVLTFENKPIQSIINEIENSDETIKDQHLIIDISENLNTNIEEIKLFLNLSNRTKSNGTSFVLICENVDIDSVPEELNVVPTFTEALDILEMDAIERDLGF